MMMVWFEFINAMKDVANQERFGRQAEKTSVNISSPRSKACLKLH
jgi:hypothetical protein